MATTQFTATRGILAQFINWILPCIHPDVSSDYRCEHCGEQL